MDVDEDGLPRVLRAATLALRDAPEPSDRWKRRVLRAVANAPRAAQVAAARPSPNSWSMRPMTAIAAGLICALVGGATVTWVLRPLSGRGAVPAIADASDVSLVRFTLDAPTATAVSIVGDFNGWNPRALPMRRSADGHTWEVEVPLPPGRYAYSFLVDGSLARDPRAPSARDDDFGSPNSIVMVSGS
jgi:hypothetical protein